MVQNYWTARRPRKGVTNNGKLITVPDQSLSIVQIIDRFQKGLEVPRRSDAYYSEDETDYDGLDLVDKSILSDSLKEDVKAIEARLAKQKSDEEAQKAKQTSPKDPPKDDAALILS